MGYSQGVAQSPVVNNYAPQQIINNNLIIPNFAFDQKFIDSLINQKQSQNSENLSPENAYMNFFKNWPNDKTAANIAGSINQQEKSNIYQNTQKSSNLSISEPILISVTSFPIQYSQMAVTQKDEYKAEPISKYESLTLADPNFICFSFFKFDFKFYLVINITSCTYFIYINFLYVLKYVRSRSSLQNKFSKIFYGTKNSENVQKKIHS